MIAMSILAMAMVIYLFGGYVDSLTKNGSAQSADYLPDVHS